MRLVEPAVFLIGQTTINRNSIEKYLESVGTNWKPSTKNTDSENLVEIMGRLCYRSWEPGLNKNVTRVRTDSEGYLQNIKAQKHGSCFEHVNFNFIFSNVSRVFTHELITHRVGTAKSQESLRFVRNDENSYYFPIAFKESEEALKIFIDTTKFLGKQQKKITELFKLNDEKSFKKKKLITSAMRRLLPDGISTTIGWSANARTLYNVIQLRTHPSAEEEIRVVFNQVAKILLEEHPKIFGDIFPKEEGEEKGVYWYSSRHGQI